MLMVAPRATRAKTTAMAETPPEMKQVIMTPEAAERPLTRCSAVFCTHFGHYRKELYPDSFFCHGCDMAENDNVKDINLMRSSKFYSCTGGHTSFIQPTTKKTEYIPSKPLPMVLDMHDDEVVDGCEDNNDDDDEETDFLDKVAFLVSPQRCHTESTTVATGTRDDADDNDNDLIGFEPRRKLDMLQLDPEDDDASTAA